MDTRIKVLMMYRLALAVDNDSFVATVWFVGCALVTPFSAPDIVWTLFPVVEVGA